VVIGILLAVVYVLGCSYALVRFVARDMAYYWGKGETYTLEELNSAMTAGALYSVAWPIMAVGSGLRVCVERMAHRMAVKLYDTETFPTDTDIPAPTPEGTSTEVEDNPAWVSDLPPARDITDPNIPRYGRTFTIDPAGVVDGHVIDETTYLARHR
jgi:hypothetical protein